MSSERSTAATEQSISMDTPTQVGATIAWALTFLIVSFATITLGSYAFMWLWNQAVPDVFGLPQITHRQGLCLLLGLYIVSTVWAKTNISVRVKK